MVSNLKKREHSYIYPMHIFFWIVIAVVAVFNIFTDLKDENFIELATLAKQYVSNNGILSAVLGVMAIAGVSIFAAIIQVFPLSILYMAIIAAYLLNTLGKLDKTDFKNKEYYREILPNMSAAVLSYIEDFKISKKDVIATLMGLELKKKIKIGDDITVIDEDDSGLCENEKYIFGLVKSKKLKEVNMLTFKQSIEMDCKKNKLIEDKRMAKKRRWKVILISVVVYILILFLFNMFVFSFNAINGALQSKILGYIGIILTLMFMIVVAGYPMASFYTIFIYLAFSSYDPYVRTFEGKKLNTRLEGLRKYINDYSKLEEKNKESIVIWEEYLIYSVILGINNKAAEEIAERLDA